MKMSAFDQMISIIDMLEQDDLEKLKTEIQNRLHNFKLSKREGEMEAHLGKWHLMLDLDVQDYRVNASAVGLEEICKFSLTVEERRVDFYTRYIQETDGYSYIELECSFFSTKATRSVAVGNFSCDRFVELALRSEVLRLLLPPEWVAEKRVEFMRDVFECSLKHINGHIAWTVPESVSA
jgi:hypothetical protein